jgi:serine/threonine-protein kinase
MGEVYRARDSKLDREVAIKVLPDALANNPDRMARFDREAKVLAALNHPNIAAIYGLEDRAIVMELVEGPTLADRLAMGPIALQEALKIAALIADALEAAHEKGTVHRDLKPANIKASPEGVVKVLDFGLATAVQATGRDSSQVMNSPTLTMGATEVGVILGTAAYMSPEQAAGRQVDKRADIWSFGVVLWEMLAGRRLFDGGESVSHTLADVLRAEVDFERIPAPQPIKELLKRCLDRDIKSRLRDIGEARVAISRYLEHPDDPLQIRPQPPAHPAWLPWAIAAMAVIGAGAAVWAPWRVPPTADLIRFEIPQPEKTSFGPNAPPALSPDGRKLAFIGRSDANQVWVRSLDTLEARPLPGTESAAATVFWSPDSRSLAYWNAPAPFKLKRVDVAGGPPQSLCDTGASPPTGAWSPDGVIIFQNDGLMRVPAAGGDCAPLTKLDSTRGETAHRLPFFLPDRRHFV